MDKKREKVKCPNCGIIFYAYRSAHRKFDNQTCYNIYRKLKNKIKEKFDLSA